MIKQVLSAAGFGLAGYVLYQAWLDNKGITTGEEGGYIDAALGVIGNGFSKVSFSEGLGMQISLNGIAHIKGWEGFRANVYLDAGGKPTIGYGHLIKPTESFTTITEAAAVQLLVQDLSFAEEAVNRLVKVQLTQSQYDALVSFVFNVGAGAFARSTLLKRLNAGQYADAKLEFAKWVKAGGKTIVGLVNRRRADAALFAGVGVA